ncbi:methylmalonyl-CoA epimerase, partial [bacterium]|nr:methylmalonyl-CoA epimerase [bacterium]
GALGLKAGKTETIPAMSLRVAKLKLGEADIELLESTDHQSTIGRFIADRGPGIHHLCIEVDDIEKALEELRKTGFRLLDERPRRGAGGVRIAFVHPKSCGGVLLELAEKR